MPAAALPIRKSHSTCLRRYRRQKPSQSLPAAYSAIDGSVSATFRYLPKRLPCILMVMQRLRSYRAPMWIGLIGGALVTYVLMNYVWSMAPWEAALAKEDFESHLLMRAASPDGKWIASIVREPAIDDKWHCVGCLERGVAPMSREIFGESLSIEEPQFYELK